MVAAAAAANEYLLNSISYQFHRVTSVTHGNQGGENLGSDGVGQAEPYLRYAADQFIRAPDGRGAGHRGALIAFEVLGRRSVTASRGSVAASNIDAEKRAPGDRHAPMPEFSQPPHP